MEPIPANGESIFDIDKERHIYCEYEHERFTIKKTKKNENLWLFESDHGSGSVECCIGDISEVNVEPNARRCGLGTIFATLCLVDTDMNGPDGNVNGHLAGRNQALDLIKGHKDKLEWVKTRCKSFWSLFFAADLSAANTYFNAALNSGFTQMLLEDLDDGIHGPAPTGDWKEKYDPKVGLIEKTIKVSNALWFFCQPN